jgi:hypothetical protein
MLSLVARVRSVGRRVGVSAAALAIGLCATVVPPAWRMASAQTAPPMPPTALPAETEGNALVAAGQLPEGLDLLVRAEARYRERGDRRGQARVAQRQASILRGLARLDDAVVAATRALALADDDAKVRAAALTDSSTSTTPSCSRSGATTPATRRRRIRAP